MMLPAEFDALPGGDLVRQGLADLSAGRSTAEALLVAIGAPRLRSAGLEVPDEPASWTDSSRWPEDRLYLLLAAVDSDSAHSRYNALIRRLVSCEHALEAALAGRG
jgi:hypothetical protein